MVKKGGRFTLAPVELEGPETAQTEPGSRARGPMASAIAENADSLTQLQEDRNRALERLKVDALAYQAAVANELVDSLIDTDSIFTDHIKRDRFDLDPGATDESMAELKQSLRDRGQQQSIKVFVDAEGRHQLEIGWRRLVAFRQLFQETGDPRFQKIRAKVAPQLDDVDAAYGRMVDENLIRKDISYGEMALLALRYARDPRTRTASVDEAVSILYASARRSRRNTIRRFAEFIESIGDVLGDPSGISRDLGLAAAQMVATSADAAVLLRARLLAEKDQAPEARAACVEAFVKAAAASPQGQAKLSNEVARGRTGQRKLEFRAGGLKCTVRGREIRLLAQIDFDAVDDVVLREASEAFWKVVDRSAKDAPA